MKNEQIDILDTGALTQEQEDKLYKDMYKKLSGFYSDKARKTGSLKAKRDIYHEKKYQRSRLRQTFITSGSFKFTASNDRAWEPDEFLNSFEWSDYDLCLLNWNSYLSKLYEAKSLV